MADRIQLRRDTAANWTSADPTLAAGEIGFESDTYRLKIGDGSTAWTNLAYLYTPPEINDNTNTGPTMALTDANKATRFTAAAAVVVTVAQDATVNFPIGTELRMRSAGAGGVTFTTTGLTINGTAPTLAQHDETLWRKVAADTWDVVY